MVDVSEIVAFKPDQNLKRANEEESKEAKRAKINEDNSQSQKDILKLLEDNNVDDDAEEFDEASLKRMLLLFEKRILKNQELRIKFGDNPEKFFDSELNLHGIIQEMHILSTVPHLYNIIVDLNIIPSMISLLSHENSDIANAMIELIQEMTDLNASEGLFLENPEIFDSFNAFVKSLLNAQIIQSLIQNMERLDENVKEESTGVYNSLAIIENLTEIDPTIIKDGSPVKEELISWLLKRFKLKLPFDANKLYASEILAILLQSHEGNRAYVEKCGGIDLLLRQLAVYKKHDPDTSEEQEYMFNLFDCLGLCLMNAGNRQKFLDGEGLQLMNLMLREKKLSRAGALKTLNHALMPIAVDTDDVNIEQSQDRNKDVVDGISKSNPIVVKCCNKFVEVLGLRTVFPLFMKTPVLSGKHKGGLSKMETEEHIISIIASLARDCTGQSKERFLAKFVEDDYSKVDRLVELHFQYLNKISKSDAVIEKEKKRLIEEENRILDEEMEEEFYLKRLEAGLLTLQLIDYVMICVCVYGDDCGIKNRLIDILNVRKGTTKTIRDIVREYAGNLGSESNSNQAALQEHILYLIDKF